MARSEPALTARLLGRPQLRWRGAPLDLSAAKPRALALLLAVRRTPVAKATLAELLWGPGKLGNLRSALYTLRKHAHADAWLHAADHGRALWADVASDLATFEDAAVGGRPAQALATWREAGIEGPARAALLQELELRGAPAFDDWLEVERDRVAVTFRDCLSRRAADLEREGRFADARTLLDELVREDPLDEETHRRLMRVEWRLGRVEDALERYEICRRTLADGLGLEPLDETRELYAKMREQAGSSLPIDAGHGVGAGFVGRQAEMETLDRALRTHRLVTLVGPGGVGKTRLAREAVRRWGEGQRRRACFVSLGTLERESFVVAAIANALGVGAEGHEDLLSQLGRALRTGPALLILDEVEHLPGAETVMRRLLEEAPGLRILVTSRRELGHADARTLRLEGLGYPRGPEDPGGAACDAVRLFVTAARGVVPSFALDDRVAPSVFRVCELLRGHPLGLELAAGWLRFHSCEALVEMLRGDVLALENPGLPLAERHTSLRRVMERSWSLLDEREARTLARLSVFRGGFDASAARAVAGVDARTLLDLIGKSWLQTTAGGRYDLHPLVHAFGRERLRARGEAGEIASAHAHHVLRWLAGQRDRILGAEPGPVLRAITRDFENVREAWRHASLGGQGDALRDAAEAFSLYADMQARFPDAIAAFGEAADALERDRRAAPDVAALMRIGEGTHLYRSSRLEEALAITERVLGEPRDRYALETWHQALELRANVLVRMGRYGEAESFFREVLALSRTSLPDRVSRDLRSLANVEACLGHDAEAERHYRDAIELNRTQGYVVGLAIDQNNLAELLVRQGRLDEAESMIEESLGYAEDVDVHLVPYLDLNAAEVALRRGDAGAAWGRAEAARSRAERFGQVGLRSRATTLLGRLELVRGDAARSAAWLAEAVTLAYGAHEMAGLMHAFLAWGELLRTRGEEPQAARYLQCVLDHPASEASDRREAAHRLAAREGGEDSSPVEALVERVAAG